MQESKIKTFKFSSTLLQLSQTTILKTVQERYIRKECMMSTYACMHVQIYIHRLCSLYGDNAMLMCILDFVLSQELTGTRRSCL